MGRAGPMGQLIMDFTGLVLGWACSTWARAGLGRELVSPWRTLICTCARARPFSISRKRLGGLRSNLVCGERPIR